MKNKLFGKRSFPGKYAGLNEELRQLHHRQSMAQQPTAKASLRLKENHTLVPTQHEGKTVYVQVPTELFRNVAHPSLPLMASETGRHMQQDAKTRLRAFIEQQLKEGNFSRD
ncbi:Uncharacterised protein [uncultured archaeon]|nr:Uncharacterised protein [uncultured archaeon]